MATPQYDPINPLKAKSAQNTAAAQAAIKREIENILSSYVGWFDPFAELIQNGLDAVDERRASAGTDAGYEPSIRVIIDVRNNKLTVSDNGVGLSREKFEQFLAPSFSFESGRTRGHKGVGATYLAYGFNYIQIATKTPNFSYVAKMEDARKWLTDPSPATDPLLIHDKASPVDKTFEKFDQGVSITLKFDGDTKPSTLDWIKATSADTWQVLLQTKTGLGAVVAKAKVNLHIAVRAKDGSWSRKDLKTTAYNWPHSIVPRTQSLQAVEKKASELFEKQGRDFRMPASFSRLDGLYAKYVPGNCQKL